MPDFQVRSDQLFLCFGDSITDCGRRGLNAPLGTGYVSLFKEMVTARHPESAMRYLNRGISGDTVIELRNRLAEDVLAEQPDWLTILIGINDLGHHVVQKPTIVPPDLYENTYREILRRVREETRARVVLMEPFFLSHETDRETVPGKMAALLPEYLAVVKKMAQEFQTLHVLLQAVFEKHLKRRSFSEFAPEPVHPARPGHMVIAQALYDILCR